MKATRLTSWLLLAILLLAFGLRLYRLGADSLWYDETVSVMLAGKSTGGLLAHTAGDIHPPGYYLLLHAWLRLAGTSEFAAAFPSLFFGVILVALAAWLGRRLYGRTVGLLAALLVATSPFNVWYSQEVRMYTLGAALGVGVLTALLSLLDAPEAVAKRRRALAVYVACGALGLWVLYYFAFLLVAANLMAAAWWLAALRRGLDRRVLGRWALEWVIAQAAILLLYAPWLPIAWRQATQPPVPPWRSWTGLGDLLLQSWSALSLGQSAPGLASVWPALVVTLGLVVLALVSAGSLHGVRPTLPNSRGSGIATAGRENRTLGSTVSDRFSRSEPTVRLIASDWRAWVLAGHVVLPVGLIALASMVTPLFHVRYVFIYSPPFYVLLAAGLAVLGRLWRVGAWLAAAVLLGYAGASLAAYHTDARYAADDLRSAAAFLGDRWRPGDAILVDAGYTYPALLTYWEGGPIAWRGRLTGDGWPAAGDVGPDVFLAGTVDGDPGLGWGDAASDFYAMPWPATEAALERLADEYDRLWLYRLYDTVTDPQGAIRAWLTDNTTPFEDQVFGGESQLRVQGYLTSRDPLVGVDPAELRDEVAAGGALRLAWAGIRDRQVQAGGALDLAAVWQVQAALPEGTTLYAGLVDGAGRRWAQADEQPLGSLYAPSAWPAGAQVRTPLRIPVPPGTPRGDYTLEIGWYRFVDGQPRWLPFTSGDRVSLGAIRVVPPADWQAVPLPAVQYPAGVSIGRDRLLLGLSAPRLSARAGESVTIDLYWQGQASESPQAAGASEGSEEAVTVVQLTDGAGRALPEVAVQRGAPVDLEPGEVRREQVELRLPGGLESGAYGLALGVQRPDGSWLPVRRGPIPLGTTYPLTTVFVESRPLSLSPPAAGRPLPAQLGDSVRFVGYDLWPQAAAATCADPAAPCTLSLTLHWQALAPVAVPLKLFVHAIEPGNPAAIVAQADIALGVPATAWAAGEYMSETVTLELPAGRPPGPYALIAGFYDEAGGGRLPVLGVGGQPQGDSLFLQTVP